MFKQADIRLSGNVFAVSGDLNCFNVMAVYKKSLPQLDKLPALEFDFSTVKSSDSAGLALIIQWIRYANSQNKPIYFHRISSHILALARAAGLETLIKSK